MRRRPARWSPGNGLRGYGKLIVIKHNQEYNSVYAHNDKLLVKEDDQVAQGQKIAELGSSETDRPKLHFEIRKQGQGGRSDRVSACALRRRMEEPVNLDELESQQNRIFP